MSGNKSADPDLKDKLTYAWKQTGGSPLVSLIGSDQPIASFKAPDLSANTTLTFALTVSDGQRKNNTDTVNVTVFKPQGFPLWLIIVIVESAGVGGVLRHGSSSSVNRQNVPRNSCPEQSLLSKQ